jgi:hypothetical protein
MMDGNLAMANQFVDMTEEQMAILADANDILFRCSSLGHLMPGPREKAGQLGADTITHLTDVYVSYKYGRREEVHGKFLEKGNLREEDALTLLSRVEKRFFKKNDRRLSNGFITGECDVFMGEDVEHAEETIDTKTSWSAHTFFRAKMKPLDFNYKWQGVGYMWLTRAKKHTVAYCLVNGTAQAIMDEKRKLAYRFGPDPQVNPEYKKQAKQIEINHIFDLFAFKEENPWFEFDNDLSEWKYDIPMNERLFKFTFERKEEEIISVKNRVIECRKWMLNNLFNAKAH